MDSNSRPPRSNSFNRTDNNSSRSSYSSRSSSGDGNQRSNGGYNRNSGNQGGSSRYNGNRNNGGGGRGGRFARPIRRLDPSKFISEAKAKIVEEIYVPKHAFIDFEIEPQLKKNIVSKGYITPTPIQDQTIPYILEGHDVIGLANTGTGKTAAFLIPLINKILKDSRNNVLIIVPTRELAVQINTELRDFSAGTTINSALCIGGADIRRQTMNLKRNPQFVIGTPGRLKDLCNRRALNLAYFGNIVLDEVDRMLDMGFIDDIKFLVAHMADQKQSLFFSATMPRQLEGIVNTFLKDPITVSVGTRDTSTNVHQDVIRVSGRQEKDMKLYEILAKEEFKKVLIFTRTKRAAETLCENLLDRKFKAQSIHGDKSQSKREKALMAFRNNIVDILVATDVAARGLDISNISHVINYDAPENYDDYVHRIGRTGRGDKKGFAITFVD